MCFRPPQMQWPEPCAPDWDLAKRQETNDRPAKPKKQSIENGLIGYFAATCSVGLHAVQKIRAAFDGPKNEIAIGQKEWGILDRSLGGDAHWRRATIRGSNPNAGMSTLVAPYESDLLSIVRNRVASNEIIRLNEITRKKTLRFFAGQIPDPEFVAGRLAIGRQVEKALPIGGERRRYRIPLRRNLVVALIVMEPNGAVLRSDSSNERFAIRGHGNTLLRGRAESQLLRISIRKALPPDMKLATLICG